MTESTIPTQMKKNVIAARLDDMGLSIFSVCNRKYRKTPDATAST